MYCRAAREGSSLQLKRTEGGQQLQGACREAIFHSEEPALDAAALNVGTVDAGEKGDVSEPGGACWLSEPPVPKAGWGLVKGWEHEWLCHHSHCITQSRLLPLWASSEQWA